MKGLINGSMAGDEPADGAPTEETQNTQSAPPTGGKLTITPEKVREGLHVNEKQGKQVDAIVRAGITAMYSPKTRQMLKEAVDRPEDDATKIGQGVAGLMGILNREAKGSLPQDMIIPAGIVLCAEAAQFISELGGDVTDRDVGDAIEIFMSVVMEAAGIDHRKISEMGERALAGAASPKAEDGPGVQNDGALEDEQ